MLDWRALVNAVTNLRVSYNAGNCLSSLGRFSFSGRTLLNRVSMEQWWNDIDWGKLKYWERNIIQRVW
jgi:hypothetical protein